MSNSVSRSLTSLTELRASDFRTCHSTTETWEIDKPGNRDTVVDNSPCLLRERIRFDTALDHVNGLGSADKAVENIVVANGLLKARKRSVVMHRLLDGLAEVIGHLFSMFCDTLKGCVHGLPARLKTEASNGYRSIVKSQVLRLTNMVLNGLFSYSTRSAESIPILCIFFNHRDQGAN